MTGCKPFVEDESRSVMQKIRLERYTAPSKLVPNIPSRLERILARCMEKAPINRYPATQALIDDLMEYLASRVPINHNARLVMYLRDAGLIEQKEAELILAASVPRTIHRTPGDRTLVRSALIMYFLLFLAVFASGGAIQASNGRFSDKPDDFNAVSGQAVVPENAGFLRVVVEPWADVYVDGQFVVTTPTAAPIPLSPGKHYVNLKNPYYLEQKAEVAVRLKKTSILDVRLRPNPKVHGRSKEASGR
jgi:serine/threonine-protein kinase